MKEEIKHFKLSKFRTAFFSRKYLFVLFLLIILSLIDGIMTIHLLDMGAWEANPLMRLALSVSNEFFFFLKYFLTAGGLLSLLLNGKRRIFMGVLTLEEIAGFFVLFYEGLIIYEIAIYYLMK